MDNTILMNSIKAVAKRVAELATKLEKQPALGSLDALELYVQSRGQGLITNGTGLLGTNKNFSGAIFNPKDSDGVLGSFEIDKLNQVLLTDERIPVKANTQYRLQMSAKTIEKKGDSRAYALLSCYDADGENILNEHIPYVTFRIARDQEESDNYVYVHQDDIARVEIALQTNRSAALAYLADANYTNAKGYTYPTGTYTRNLLNTHGLATNALQLSSDGFLVGFGGSFNRPLKAGETLCLTKTGGVYLYPIPSLANALVPTTWTKYNANVNTSTLRPGTAFVKIGIQANRSSQDGNKTAISAIDFREL